jgi:predicted nuclease of predicted toxin-antitoxin system
VAGFLLDENLPPAFAQGFRLLGLDVLSVGDAGAPPRGSTDQAIVDWCIQNDRVLVTRDRGRKNREMINLLRQTNVSVVLLAQGTSNEQFVRQFVRRYDRLMDELAAALRRGGAQRRRMSANGRLESL